MSYRKATLPPVEACAVCKRRPADGHDSTCPARESEPQKPRKPAQSLADWVREQNEKRAKETPMASSIQEALTNAGITTLQQPAAESAPHQCRNCGEDDLNKFRVYPIGTVAALCGKCQAAAANAGRRKAKPTQTTSDGLVLEVAAVVETPIDTSTTPAIDDEACENAANEALLAADLSPIVDDAGGTDWVAEPTPSFEPTPRTHAELRAERARVVEYLAKLDEEIAQAEALEALKGYTPDQLAVMLEDARRQARLLELALGGKAA